MTVLDEAQIKSLAKLAHSGTVKSLCETVLSLYAMNDALVADNQRLAQAVRVLLWPEQFPEVESQKFARDALYHAVEA